MNLKRFRETLDIYILKVSKRISNRSFYPIGDKSIDNSIKHLRTARIQDVGGTRENDRNRERFDQIG